MFELGGPSHFINHHHSSPHDVSAAPFEENDYQVPNGSANFTDLDLLPLQERFSFDVVTAIMDTNFSPGLMDGDSLLDFLPVPQEEPKPEAEGGPEKEEEPQQQQRPPYGWDDKVMKMSTPVFNRYITHRGLNMEQNKDIKAYRRRLKNRCYAKTSRKRRMDKAAAQKLENAQLHELLGRAEACLTCSSPVVDDHPDIQRHINSNLGGGPLLFQPLHLSTSATITSCTTTSQLTQQQPRTPNQVIKQQYKITKET